MASKKSQKMRIILKAYDHQLIDFAASKLIDTVKKTGAKVSGPVPLERCTNTKIPVSSSSRELTKD